MKHYTDRIAAWLSGEMPPDEAAELERHLEECADCAGEARAQRAIWDELGAHDTRRELENEPSLWPSVRERTFGRREAVPWFFGGNLAVRSGLAACAVAAGLFVAAVLPGGGVTGTAAASDDVENLWLASSSFSDSDTTNDLDGIWLTAGLDEED